MLQNQQRKLYRLLVLNLSAIFRSRQNFKKSFILTLISHVRHYIDAANYFVVLLLRRCDFVSFRWWKIGSHWSLWSLDAGGQRRFDSRNSPVAAKAKRNRQWQRLRSLPTTIDDKPMSSECLTSFYSNQRTERTTEFVCFICLFRFHSTLTLADIERKWINEMKFYYRPICEAAETGDCSVLSKNGFHLSRPVNKFRLSRTTTKRNTWMGKGLRRSKQSMIFEWNVGLSVRCISFSCVSVIHLSSINRVFANRRRLSTVQNTLRPAFRSLRITFVNDFIFLIHLTRNVSFFYDFSCFSHSLRLCLEFRFI